MIKRQINEKLRHFISMEYLKSIFELFNISLWSVLTKVAKQELCEAGKQKLVFGGEMFKFPGSNHKREFVLFHV